ncbi:MAG: hypothetical protein HY821_21205 [Acidobacteria bacterium]|nr:hypothetical protein [Acidobacteriota bacterium]
MSCQECITNSAMSLRQIVAHLTPQMARQLFTSMYPESACLPMGQMFVHITRSGEERKPSRLQPEYAPAVYAEPLYHAAVA